MKKIKAKTKRIYKDLPADIIISILHDFYFLTDINYAIVEDPKGYEIATKQNISFEDSIRLLFGKFKMSKYPGKVYQIFEGFVVEKRMEEEITTIYISAKMLMRYFIGFGLDIGDLRSVKKPLKEIEDTIEDIDFVERRYIITLNRLKSISRFKNYNFYYLNNDNIFRLIDTINLLNRGYKPATKLNNIFKDLYRMILPIKENIRSYNVLFFTEDIGLRKGVIVKGFIIFKFFKEFTKIYYISLSLPQNIESSKEKMKKINIIKKSWELFFSIIDTDKTEGVIVDYIKYDDNLIKHFDILKKLGFKKIKVYEVEEDYNYEVIERGFTYMITNDKIKTKYKRELRYQLVLLKRELKIFEPYDVNTAIVFNTENIDKLLRLYFKKDDKFFHMKEFILKYIDDFKHKNNNICLMYSLEDGDYEIEYAFFFEIKIDPFINEMRLSVYYIYDNIVYRDTRNYFINSFFEYILEIKGVRNLKVIHFEFDFDTMIKESGDTPDVLDDGMEIIPYYVFMEIPEFYEVITNTRDRSNNRIFINFISKENVKLLVQHFRIGRKLPYHNLTSKVLTKICQTFTCYGKFPDDETNLIYITDFNRTKLISVRGYRINNIENTFYALCEGIITIRKFRGKGYGSIILDYFYQKMVNEKIYWIILIPAKDAVWFWYHKQNFKLIDGSNFMLKSLYDWKSEYKFIKSEKEKEIERINIENTYDDTNIDYYKELLEEINKPVLKTNCKHPKL